MREWITFARISTNMKTSHLLLIAGLMIAYTSVDAQLGYGFRAGLSYSKFVGPSELNSMGEELGAYNFTSGFHIGVSVNYSVTDQFGFRGEALFSQKGTEFTYDGDSYYFLARGRTDERLVLGKRNVDQSVSMATFEIPIVAYYKIAFVEVSGGFYGSLLAAATGGGSLAMSEVQSLTGNSVEDFDVTLQHNYNKDGAGGASLQTQLITVDGSPVQQPVNTGAYYDFDFKDKNLYQVFDFGLVGGINFYLNDGLYIGGRVTYGLVDLDRNEYDISFYELNDDGSYIQRADKNTNLTIQASVGFLFGG